MAGMTVDPDKCRDSMSKLFYATVAYAGPATLLAKYHRTALPEAVGFSAGAFATYYLQTRFNDLTFWYPTALKNAWNDCDIGGGLKRRAENFKKSIKAAVEKALPSPQPLPNPANFTPVALSEELGSRTLSYQDPDPSLLYVVPSAIPDGTYFILGALGVLVVVSAGVAIAGGLAVAKGAAIMVGAVAL